MSQVLYTRMEVFIKFFQRGIISHQNTDIHPLREKTLKVLADSGI